MKHRGMGRDGGSSVALHPIKKYSPKTALQGEGRGQFSLNLRYVKIRPLYGLN